MNVKELIGFLQRCTSSAEVFIEERDEWGNKTNCPIEAVEQLQALNKPTIVILNKS